MPFRWVLGPYTQATQSHSGSLKQDCESMLLSSTEGTQLPACTSAHARVSQVVTKSVALSEPRFRFGADCLLRRLLPPDRVFRQDFGDFAGRNDCGHYIAPFDDFTHDAAQSPVTGPKERCAAVAGAHFQAGSIQNRIQPVR